MSKKVIDLREVDSFEGLVALGVDTLKNESVQVPLGFVKQGADAANAAAQSATDAAKAAATATTEANIATELTNTAIENANNATENVNTAIENAITATQAANTATANAQAQASAATAAALAANDTAELADQKATVANNAAKAAVEASEMASTQAAYAKQQGDVAGQAALNINEHINLGLAALVGTAPDALNTLQELAAAIGDDPNFATTMLAEIAKRVMFDDPRLTDARNVINQAGGVLKIWTGTQVQYDALNKQSDTLYFIS